MASTIVPSLCLKRVVCSLQRQCKNFNIRPLTGKIRIYDHEAEMPGSKNGDISVKICIIGAGQAGLSTAYHLHQTEKLPLEDILIVDDSPTAGGSWPKYYESLNLFSPAEYSSLPGLPMQLLPSQGSDIRPSDGQQDDHKVASTRVTYPTKADMVEYLRRYETEYNFQIMRSLSVTSVEVDICQGEAGRNEKHAGFTVICVGTELSDKKISVYCDHVVNCTGLFQNKYFPPAYYKSNNFDGLQIHSGDYSSPRDLNGCDTVCIVGGGNSGAQILADIFLFHKREAASEKHLIWCTQEEPQFYDTHIDGKDLFDRNAEIYNSFIAKMTDDSKLTDETSEAIRSKAQLPPFRFNKIVIASIPGLVEAMQAGAYSSAYKPFDRAVGRRLYWDNLNDEALSLWNNAAPLPAIPNDTPVDAIIWCTGFRPALSHLENILPGISARGQTSIINGTCESKVWDNLWFVGYGDWCGFGSGAIKTVNIFAQQTAHLISGRLLKTVSNNK